GTYIARFIYDPALQGLGAADYPRTTVEFSLQIGTPEDLERESKAVRNQLAEEIRAFIAMADEVKAKMDEFRDKPPAAWDPSLKAWRDRSIELQKRADPRKVPEYTLLRLDVIADTGFENMADIFLSAARIASRGQRETALEGLTRLRQTAEFWLGDIAPPPPTRPPQPAKP